MPKNNEILYFKAFGPCFIYFFTGWGAGWEQARLCIVLFVLISGSKYCRLLGWFLWKYFSTRFFSLFSYLQLFESWRSYSTFISSDIYGTDTFSCNILFVSHWFRILGWGMKLIMEAQPKHLGEFLNCNLIYHTACVSR